MEDIMKQAIGDIDADYSEIRLERAHSTTLAYMGPVLEETSTVFRYGGCVRVCIRGGWGFASFNSVDDAPASARKAARMAELVAGGGTVLAPVPTVRARLSADVSIDPESVPLEEKVDLLRRYNDILLSDPVVVNTNTVYRDLSKTVWLLNTDGTYIEREEKTAGMRFMAIAKDGANVQRAHDSVGDRRGYATVQNREADAEKVVKNVRDLIRAPKVESGLHSVVLDPTLAGVFIHEAFGHLSESDFIYENEQAKEMMKLGRQFGPDILNVVDNGAIEGDLGYIGYDDEGVKKGNTMLIRNGILTGRLHSRETAGRMGETPTGNARAISASFSPIVRMTGTYIEPGETSFEEMISSVKNGIYACSYLGGMTDLERFTFSSNYAYRIENGKIAGPVRDAILSGNVFETLKNIEMIGDDLQLLGGLGGCGKGGQSPLPVSTGSPHILIRNVLIG